MRSAKHPDFLNFLSKAAEDAEAPKTVETLFQELQTRLREMSKNQKLYMLRNLSSTERNAHLWRLLSPKELSELISDESEMQEILGLVHNCSKA